MKKHDIYIIVITLIIALSIQGFYMFSKKGKGEYVHIYKGGKLYKSLKLSENNKVVITDGKDINIIVIENGCVYMKEANCHDGLCVKMVKISGAGESIVCLPHKIVVEIEGEKKDIDDSTY